MNIGSADECSDEFGRSDSYRDGVGKKDVMQLLAGPPIEISCQAAWTEPWLNRGGINITAKNDGINLLCCDDEAVMHNLVDIFRGDKKHTGLVEATLKKGHNRYLIDRGATSFIKKVSAVFDSNDGLIGTMTGREWLRLHAALLLHNFDKETQEQFILQICDKLGLAPYLDSIIGDASTKGLSTGQRRRLSLALILLQRPRIIFIFDPLVGLDAMTAVSLRDFMKDELCQHYNINLIWMVSDISASVWEPCGFVSIILKWSTFVAGAKEEIERVAICSEVSPVRALWVSEHERLRVQNVYMDAVLYKQIGNLHLQVICDVISKMIKLSGQSWIGMPSVEDDKEYSVQHSFYHDDMKIAFIKNMSPTPNEETAPMAISNHLALMKECECDHLASHPNECFRCYYIQSYHGTRHLIPSLIYSVKICILSKLRPYKAYFAMISGLLALHLLLGCIFYRIPNRIATNPLAEEFNSDNFVIPDFVQDMINLVLFGLQGSATVMGPRPLLEILVSGVRGNNEHNLIEFVKKPAHICLARGAIRCIADKFPLDDEYYGYPNRNLCEPAYSSVINYSTETSTSTFYPCSFDADSCKDEPFLEILDPTSVIMDVVSLLQAAHFTLYNIDFDEYFPKLLGEDGAIENSDRGIPYWTNLLNKAKGFVDVTTDCFGIPNIPCTTFITRCNLWPRDSFHNGTGNNLASKIDLDKYLNEITDVIRNAKHSFETITRDPAEGEDQVLTDYWQQFRRIVPVKYDLPELLSGIFTPQLEDHYISFIFGAVNEFVEIAITAKYPDGHSNFITLMNRIQKIFYSLFDMIWQSVNTTGCIFAVNASLPFLSMESLFRRGSDVKRYQYEYRHGYYNPIIYGLAQLLADICLSVLPLVVMSCIWLGMAGYFTFEGSGMLVIIMLGLAFGSQGFCCLISHIFPKTEVSLIVTACTFIVMLLFSGFVVRTPTSSGWMKFFEALSLHRWSYFSIMQQLFPPECKAPELYTDGLPFYGVIPYPLMLTLAGVPQDCSYYILFLFLLGASTRILTLGVLWIS